MAAMVESPWYGNCSPHKGESEEEDGEAKHAPQYSEGVIRSCTKRLPHLSLGDPVSHIRIFGDDGPPLALLACCVQKEQG